VTAVENTAYASDGSGRRSAWRIVVTAAKLEHG
jgi:hypothetical protein